VSVLSRSLRFAAYFVAFVLGLIALLATLTFALSLADLYALTIGGVEPGDPMLGDRFAPSLGYAFAFTTICGSVLAGSAWLCGKTVAWLDSAPTKHSGAVV
jgi:hypothetical protein